MALTTIAQIASKNLNGIGTALFIGIFLYAYYLRRRQLNQGVAKRDHPSKKFRQEPVSLHPQFDALKCIGCGSCQKACPEGEIIQLVDHKAQLIDTKKCIGHGECALCCPTHAITMVVGSAMAPAMIPKRGEGNETNIGGLYIAGDVTGRVLIHSAMKQGLVAADHALTHLAKDPEIKYDLVIVGAGPAGIAAALKAKEMKANYLCIDQGKIGGSICHYAPSQQVKVVELSLPLVGKLALPKPGIVKSDLLAVIKRICDGNALRIVEHMNMLELKPISGGFVLNTSKGSVTAAKVILATGIAGGSRKLVMNTDNPSAVLYDLDDANAFSSRALAVYSSGNCALNVTYRNTLCHRCSHTAIAVAIALCQKPLGNRVTLILNNKKLGGCNLAALPQLAYLVKKKRLQLFTNSRVLEKRADKIIVEQGDVTHEINNELVFVFNGVTPPLKFLKELGIEVEKTYSQPIEP